MNNTEHSDTFEELNNDSNTKSKFLPQWERRVKLVKFIYSFLIDDSYSIQEMKHKAFKEFNFDANQLKLVEYFLDHKYEMIKTIEKHMSDKWEFDRLNYVDQAILLEACSEQKVWNTEKPVLIDQSVITAKKYSDIDSYKFINAMLEKVL